MFLLCRISGPLRFLDLFFHILKQLQKCLLNNITRSGHYYHDLSAFFITRSDAFLDDWSQVSEPSYRVRRLLFLPPILQCSFQIFKIILWKFHICIQGISILFSTLLPEPNLLSPKLEWPKYICMWTDPLEHSQPVKGCTTKENLIFPFPATCSCQ